MRARPLYRRLLFPVLERAFTHDRYAQFLEELTRRAVVVPLRELARTAADRRPVVALRHDVDRRLENALELARLEHERGVRSTYFVLHTAAYWRRPDLDEALRMLQNGYGHEVGWHNDLVTLQCVDGVEPRGFLRAQLTRLRAAGLRIDGSAAHGSPHCYRLGFHNNYFFTDFAAEVDPRFPHRDAVPTPRGDVALAKGTLAEFGLAYEAYHLDNDLYFSDSSFDAAGRRWHPDDLDLGALRPGTKTIVLLHPCHWHASLVDKSRELAARAADTLARAG